MSYVSCNSKEANIEFDIFFNFLFVCLLTFDLVMMFHACKWLLVETESLACLLKEANI